MSGSEGNEAKGTERENDIEVNEVPDVNEIVERWRELPQEEQSEVVKTISQESPQGLAKVLGKYEPEQFNDLIKGFLEYWHKQAEFTHQRSSSIIKLVGGTVLIFFFSLAVLTYFGVVPGGTLIFFAGTVLGYIVRIGSEIG